MDLFEVQEELGRGTFGVVRKCVDKRSQKVLAVKEINMELAGQNEHVVANEIKVSYIDFDNVTMLCLISYLIVSCGLL
jgi:serine/threonine protein kinase